MADDTTGPAADASAGASAGAVTRIVIVGAGQAGGWVAKTLRAEGFSGEIVLIGAEPYPPHERPPLSKAVLTGEQSADVCHLFPADFVATERIDHRAGVSVSQIDRAARRLQCSDGTALTYDKLVIATGARVRKLGLPGAEHVLYLRSIADSAVLRERLSQAQHATIIGAGWIGLEVAAAARKRGVAVTLLEALPRACARSVPQEVSDVLSGLHREHEVDLRLECGIEGIVREGARLGVRPAKGAAFATDVVVAGIGVVPNIELAQAAGLTVDNGIVVDEHGRTSDPHIHAAGDVTLHPNRLLGRNLRLESWANAQNQGVVVGKALLGKSPGYAELPWFWSDQYDVNLQILGQPQTWTTPVVRGDLTTRRCSLFYLREGRIEAVIAINAARDLSIARRLIQRGIAAGAEQLADPATKLDALLKAAN